MGSLLWVRLIGPGLDNQGYELASHSLRILAWCAPGFVLHGLFAVVAVFEALEAWAHAVGILPRAAAKDVSPPLEVWNVVSFIFRFSISAHRSRTAGISTD